MRDSKQLLLDTRPFAADQPARSWWCVISTGVLLLAAVAMCMVDVHWAVRLPLSVVSGLLIVRMFVIYHDFQHGSILKGSRIADALMTVFGVVTLNAPSIWARSHNHHHRNNCRLHGGFIGSFNTMTTDQYQQATGPQRLGYRIERHPLTIALAYLTVFFIGMTLRPFLLAPRQHIDCGVALVVHAAIIATLLAWGGWTMLAFVLLIPGLVAGALGAYLFYAQHNYPGVVLRDRTAWDHVFAAMHSSSYIPMNPVMAWFTANIGYHHVHHLNHKIPFYRLPEAMAAFEELRRPGQTTLAPRDIARCLRLKLWDRAQDRFVTFAEHNAAATA